MAQQVQVLSSKPDSLEPTWLKERTNSHKLPSDINMYAVMCIHT